jgi:hypothetical protein
MVSFIVSRGKRICFRPWCTAFRTLMVLVKAYHGIPASTLNLFNASGCASKSAGLAKNSAPFYANRAVSLTVFVGEGGLVI